MSTRDRAASVTSPSACMGCHSILNPPGYALEGFDALGRSRAQEIDYASDGTVTATHPLNTSVTMPSQGKSFSVAGDADLRNLALQPEQGPACYVRQMFRYYRAQSEDPTADACLMASVLDQITAGLTLQDALAAIVVNSYTGVNELAP